MQVTLVADHVLDEPAAPAFCDEGSVCSFLLLGSEVQVAEHFANLGSYKFDMGPTRASAEKTKSFGRCRGGSNDLNRCWSNSYDPARRKRNYWHCRPVAVCIALVGPRGFTDHEKDASREWLSVADN